MLEIYKWSQINFDVKIYGFLYVLFLDPVSCIVLVSEELEAYNLRSWLLDKFLHCVLSFEKVLPWKVLTYSYQFFYFLLYISFYISRYNFLQLFRTSSSIVNIISCILRKPCVMYMVCAFYTFSFTNLLQ